VTASRESLWRAYAIAPAVAPLSFSAIIGLLGAACTEFGWTCNPAWRLVRDRAYRRCAGAELLGGRRHHLPSWQR
jgi:hypothetical protein